MSLGPALPSIARLQAQRYRLAATRCHLSQPPLPIFAHYPCPSNPRRIPAAGAFSAMDQKRRKIEGAGSPVHSLIEASSGEVLASHTSGVTFRTPGGLICTDHHIKTDLDYSGEVSGVVDIFVREVVSSNKKGQEMPCLLFLAGGPGFAAPRPFESSSWLKSAVNLFRVILMDQRGTGRSSPITTTNLAKRGTPEEQAQYLSFFRADNIVRDAELVRKTLVSPDSYGGRWSIIGQSFGGFCATTYLTLAPHSLIEVMMTGGIPPDVTQPCTADAVYRALYRRVMVQNQRYYERFPSDVRLVHGIVERLRSEPGGGLRLSSGTLLTPRAFQLLGLTSLGMSGGFERLHFMLESFADDAGDVNPAFVKAWEQQMAWDSNPLYVLLHESIYCQGAASNWAAHRIRETEFRDVFDAAGAVAAGRPVYFTGEMVYPWLFEDFACLRPLRQVADLVAKKRDWGPLYDAAVLRETRVPCAAAVYYEDMYVDLALSQPTAGAVRGLRQWVTSEYKHSGIRDDGARIFDRLINMVRDQILLD